MAKSNLPNEQSNTCIIEYKISKFIRQNFEARNNKNCNKFKVKYSIQSTCLIYFQDLVCCCIHLSTLKIDTTPSINGLVFSHIL